MLRTLRLQNYRCFDHTVAFHADTVVVGRNNAGKSTIVEALLQHAAHCVQLADELQLQGNDLPLLSLWSPLLHASVTPIGGTA